MWTMRPERAILDVLLWTRDLREAQHLAHSVVEAYAEEFRGVSAPREGVLQWLTALEASRVPVAIVSTLDRVSMVAALARMGLEQRFAALVSAEDGMETTAQALLSAAIKLGRPPNKCAPVRAATCPAPSHPSATPSSHASHPQPRSPRPLNPQTPVSEPQPLALRCVAFVSDVHSIAAAHNCSMKAVAMVGVHPSFRLQTADLTCASMAELRVYNIRRLFANVGSERMDLLKQNSGDTPFRRKPIASGTID